MVTRRVDSYDRDAVRPLPGSLWAWEPEKAPALIRVIWVRWNGEEWFVGTRTLAEYTLPFSLQAKTAVNDLSRFWEACRHVAAKPGPRGKQIRKGPPRDEEVDEDARPGETAAPGSPA